MEYCGQYNLKNHSTLKIGPTNAKVVYVDKKEDIESALDMAKELKLTPYPLGGGSNTVFSDSAVDKHLFLIPRMDSFSAVTPSLSSSLYSAGIQVNSKNPKDANSGLGFPGVPENDNTECVLVQIDAGLEWDKAVEQTVELGLSGLEALSWIPGLVGASPVQNIGAYGSEAKDSISVVHAYAIEEKKFIDFKNEECEFEYRNSIFKKNPGKYFIYAITFSLLKISDKAQPSVPQYKDVISYFDLRNILAPTLKEIREAIIEIRKAKLPNPTETPNAGSYFGNPIISKEKAEELLKEFPEMPMFDFEPSSLSSSRMAGLNRMGYDSKTERDGASRGREIFQQKNTRDPSSELYRLDSHLHENDKQGHKKLFAGWLIDKAELKGYSSGNFNIHKNHALVIIGNEKGTLPELLEFENYIKQKVFDMFGVELVREPVVVE